MRQTSFQNFIRFGSSKSFTLNLGNAPKWQAKQDNPAPEVTARDWIDQVWNKSFGATTQAILKTPPYEFSPKGLADLDMSALRERAAAALEKNSQNYVKRSKTGIGQWRPASLTETA